MKRLNYILSTVIVLVSLTAEDANAEKCSYQLRGQGDRIYKTYNERTWQRTEACRIAKRDCLSDLDHLQMGGRRRPGLFCSEAPSRTGKEMDRHQCEVDLLTAKGRILDEFVGSSRWSRRQACRLAKEECSGELNLRHHRGRNPHAQCVVYKEKSKQYKGYLFFPSLVLAPSKAKKATL